MNRADDHGEAYDDLRWWRLDFTMILILLVIGAFLLLATFELWHSHVNIH